MLKRVALATVAVFAATACTQTRDATAPRPDASVASNGISADQRIGSDAKTLGGQAGAVYAMTNAAAGNAVAVFARAGDGSIALDRTVSTGGRGAGAGLGSQGSLVMSDDSKWLYAVNAGSDEISVFAVDRLKLTLTQHIASGGVHPISLTVHGDVLYVLNDGGNGNIAGFHVGAGGELTPIAKSTRPLSSSAAGPAQIEFAPDGNTLVVTEKNTNRIDVYRVRNNGLTIGPFAHQSAGLTPFGFSFADHNELIVSEAAGGAAGASSASSYRVRDDGSLRLVSRSIPTTQTAACWAIVSRDARFAFTTNTGSGSVSSFRVLSNGALSLLEARAGETGAGSTPIDAAIAGGKFLYVLTSGAGSVSAFRVGTDGKLTSLVGAGGLSATAVGLIAR